MEKTQTPPKQNFLFGFPSSGESVQSPNGEDAKRRRTEDIQLLMDSQEPKEEESELGKSNDFKAYFQEEQRRLTQSLLRTFPKPNVDNTEGQGKLGSGREEGGRGSDAQETRPSTSRGDMNSELSSVVCHKAGSEKAAEEAFGGQVESNHTAENESTGGSNVEGHSLNGNASARYGNASVTSSGDGNASVTVKDSAMVNDHGRVQVSRDGDNNKQTDNNANVLEKVDGNSSDEDDVIFVEPEKPEIVTINLEEEEEEEESVVDKARLGTCNPGMEWKANSITVVVESFRDKWQANSKVSQDFSHQEQDVGWLQLRESETRTGWASLSLRWDMESEVDGKEMCVLISIVDAGDKDHYTLKAHDRLSEPTSVLKNEVAFPKFFPLQQVFADTERLLKGGKLCIKVQFMLLIKKGIDENLGKQNSEANSSVESLFKSGLFSDVTLECEGVQFKCHKNILAMRSGVFVKMLADMTNSGSNTIFIEKSTPAVVEQLLKYVYGSKLPPKEHLKDYRFLVKLALLASTFELRELGKFCLNSALKCLNAANAAGFLLLTHKNKLAEETDQILPFVVEHLEAVRSSSGWTEIKSSPELMEKLLMRAVEFPRMQKGLFISRLQN